MLRGGRFSEEILKEKNSLWLIANISQSEFKVLRENGIKTIKEYIEHMVKFGSEPSGHDAFSTTVFRGIGSTLEADAARKMFKKL